VNRLWQKWINRRRPRRGVRILRNVDDIAIFRFTEKDVVRHRLVQDIIKAYEKAANAR